MRITVHNCPFCGGLPKLVETITEVKIVCCGCHAQISRPAENTDRMFPPKLQVVNAWNSRFNFSDRPPSSPMPRLPIIKNCRFCGTKAIWGINHKTLVRVRCCGCPSAFEFLFPENESIDDNKITTVIHEWNKLQE